MGTNLRLDEIELVGFDDPERPDQQLRIAFVTYSGNHNFVPGDVWKIGETRPCTETTQVTISEKKLHGAEVVIEPLRYHYDKDTVSIPVSIEGGNYKVNFSKA